MGQKRSVAHKSELHTLPFTERVQVLYKTLGFREISSYRYNPIAGTVFMELTL